MLQQALPTPDNVVPFNPNAPRASSVGGFLTIAGNAVLAERDAEAARMAAVAEQQAQPMISGLVGHLRSCWVAARDAKTQGVEQRMRESMLARRGEYDNVKLSSIRSAGGSDVFVMLTSMKCRGAAALLRDIYLGQANEKAWTVQPTPMPELGDEDKAQIVQAVAQKMQELMMQGVGVTVQDAMQMMRDMHDQQLAQMTEEARARCLRMEQLLEDQLVEGGYLQAINAFLDDITTFPAAFLKGPVIRRKKVLQWINGMPQAVDTLKKEIERVSPFDIFPSPTATTISDGFLIERHRLSRGDLESMIGVEGYNADAIRQVLAEYGRNGLYDWLSGVNLTTTAQSVNTEQNQQYTVNPDGLIDALQFWGNVSGQMLRDWGMDATEVPDVSKEYSVEAWLIHTYCIKAVLNSDPLARKPYYKASYEEVPGAFWGNSVADIVRDSQNVCNAAARAVVNNMAVASGPQVVVNIDRVPAGEKITTITPWKIWQVTNNMMTDSGEKPPVAFFQPTSNVTELMTIFGKFSEMADEYSGIPRYMTGDGTQGGVGRTATGLSMMIGNAGKIIKQVVANIDTNVLTPLLERFYLHNMLYHEDDSVKGDAQIVARGALSVMTKDTAQMRRNELLNLILNSPVAYNVAGPEGVANLLRETVRGLDVNPEKVVPSESAMRGRALALQMMMQSQLGGGGAAPPEKPNGEVLANGAPVADTTSPNSLTA